MYTVSEKTRENIERNTGIKSSEITSMDHEEMDKIIEKKIGKHLQLKVLEGYNLLPRGSVYIFTNRLFRNTWLERLFLGL